MAFSPVSTATGGIRCALTTHSNLLDAHPNHPQAHVHLLGSATNAATISAIHTSAFVLAFDEAKPTPALKPIKEGASSLTSEGICDFSERLWKAGGKGFGEGEGANRWW